MTLTIQLISRVAIRLDANRLAVAQLSAVASLARTAIEARYIALVPVIGTVTTAQQVYDLFIHLLWLVRKGTSSIEHPAYT